MTKVASSFALSLWLGFYAVTGLSELAHLAGIDHIGSQALEPAAGGTAAQSAFVALVALSAAGVMAATLAFLRSSNVRIARRGEAFAFGSIGLASATVVAAYLFGAPFSMCSIGWTWPSGPLPQCRGPGVRPCRRDPGRCG